MSAATKDRLLDAAEQLAAAHGLDNVSVRMIAAQAGASLSAIGFHFGAREGLIRVLLARRLAPLMARRLAALEALQASEASLGAAQILAAFLAPLFEMSARGDAGEQAFMRILAQTLVRPSAEYREVLEGELVGGVAAYRAAFESALPHLTPEEVANRLDFAIGAVGHALADPTRRAGFARSDPREDVDRLAPQLLAFVLAGMTAPATLAG